MQRIGFLGFTFYRKRNLWSDLMEIFLARNESAARQKGPRKAQPNNEETHLPSSRITLALTNTEKERRRLSGRAAISADTAGAAERRPRKEGGRRTAGGPEQPAPRKGTRTVVLRGGRRARVRYNRDKASSASRFNNVCQFIYYVCACLDRFSS